MDHRLQCTTTELYKPYISKLGTRANVYICIVRCSVKLVNFTNHKFPDMEADRSEINCTDLDSVAHKLQTCLGSIEKVS